MPRLTPEPSNRIFYRELEALRGLAALSVVLFHISENAGGIGGGYFFITVGQDGWGWAIYLALMQTILNGGAAVVLFFVLSGCVMGMNVPTEEKLGLWTYLAFMVRRVFRLFPVIPVGVGLGILAFELSPSGSSLNLNWQYVLRSLALLEIDLDGPLWTLRVELVASAIYLPMLYYVRRTDLFFHIIGLVIVWQLFFELSTHILYGTSAVTAVDAYFYCFFLGLIVPSVGKALIENIPTWLRVSCFFVAFALYAAWGSLVQWPGKWNLGSVTIASFYLIAWVMYGCPPPVQRFLYRRFPQYLGHISYSLYALHWPIIIVVAWMWVHLPYMPAGNPVAKQIFLVLTVPLLSIGAAHWCRIFIEEPSIRLGRQLASKLDVFRRAWPILPSEDARIGEHLVIHRSQPGNLTSQGCTGREQLIRRG